MHIIKKTIYILLISFITQVNLNSDVPHFVDFKYVLNQSAAGKKAQTVLQKELSDGVNKIKKQESALQAEEKEIIKQKRVISADEYTKKVTNLRAKVNTIQKNRNNLLDSVAKKRTKARSELLKNLNPIIQEYMKEKKIRMVLDKKGILLADEKLDLTKDIINILDKKLKSIKLD